jgi:hypothetical protein
MKRPVLQGKKNGRRENSPAIPSKLKMNIFLTLVKQQYLYLRFCFQLTHKTRDNQDRQRLPSN